MENTEFGSSKHEPMWGYAWALVGGSLPAPCFRAFVLLRPATPHPLESTMAGPPKAPEPQGGEEADGKFTWRQVYQKPDIAGMSALSRREEEALVKDAKAHARDVCREFVKGPFSPFLTSALP